MPRKVFCRRLYERHAHAWLTLSDHVLAVGAPRERVIDICVVFVLATTPAVVYILFKYLARFGGPATGRWLHAATECWAESAEAESHSGLSGTRLCSDPSCCPCSVRCIRIPASPGLCLRLASAAILRRLAFTYVHAASESTGPEGKTYDASPASSIT